MTNDSQSPIPDPNGPPVAPRAPQLLSGLRTLGTAFVVGGAAVVVGAGVLFVASAGGRTTMGALRSHRIQWEQRERERQEEIAQARGACSAEAVEGETPLPESHHD